MSTRMKSMVAVIAIAVWAGSALAQTTRVYSGPTNGSIDTLTNWNPDSPGFANGDTFRWNGTVAGALSLTAANFLANRDLDLTADQTSNVTIGSGEYRVRHISVAAGAGALSLGGAFRTEGGTAGFVNNWQNHSSNPVTLNGTFNNSQNIARTLAYSGVGDWLISGVFADSAGHAYSMRINGAGTVTITSTANTYTGINSMLGGVFAVARLNNGGSTSSIGKSSAAAGNLILNGGTLRHVGTAASSTDRLFQLGQTADNAVGTIENNSATVTHTLTFTGTGPITFGTVDLNRALRLGGTNTGTNSLAVAIADNGTGVVSVEKQGAGTWRLANTGNTYSGGTQIGGGHLILAGAGAAGTGGILVTAAGAELGVTTATGVKHGTGNSAGVASQLTGGVDTTVRIPDAATASSDTMLLAGFATANPGASNDDMRKSDVVTLSGTGGDLYVLDLGIGAIDNRDAIWWLDGGVWVNAVSGNSGNNASGAQMEYAGSFAAFQGTHGTTLGNYVGAYGFDQASGRVWAVLNHAGTFAVIKPPPQGTLISIN